MKRLSVCILIAAIAGCAGHPQQPGPAAGQPVAQQPATKQVPVTMANATEACGLQAGQQRRREALLPYRPHHRLATADENAVSDRAGTVRPDASDPECDVTGDSTAVADVQGELS